jgi:hypothetical protein
VVSYSLGDLDIPPSVTVKGFTVDCTMAVIPRDIPASARKFRQSPETFRVSYSGAVAKLDASGNIGVMNPASGIYRDRFWYGPLYKTMNHTRTVEYTSNIYVPIPMFLFSKSETRVFVFDVDLWVSVAHQIPVKLSKSKKMELTNFVWFDAGNRKQCSLLAS